MSTIALSSNAVIPVIVLDRSGIASELAHALASGGVHCAEVTLRTPFALEAISTMASNAPADFIVGAGTVLSVRQVEQVADAGATFVVSPGFDPEVVDRARALGLAALPGVATATEIQRAHRHGVDTVKFFPADRLGGLKTIAAFAPVFPEARFVPSGGVGPDNLEEYLSHPAVPAVSGSWLTPRDRLDGGDFEWVAARSAETSRIVGRVADRMRSEG